MYCKNCGKKLPDDARFCDRCNMSVRKKSGKMDLIEELKEERLARKKAKAVEERLKSIKKVKRKRHRIAFIIILCIIAIGLIAALVGFIIGEGFTKDTGPIEEIPKTTEQATETIKPTEQSPIATAIVLGSEDSPAAPNGDGYIITALNDKGMAYPSGFEKKTSTDGSLVFEDTLGDGRITMNSEVTNTAAKDILKQYVSIKGGNIISSNANSKAYSVTGVNGNTVYHRAGVVADGTDTFYEFTYSSSSSNKPEYELNTEYMDEYLKNE